MPRVPDLPSRPITEAIELVVTHRYRSPRGRGGGSGNFGGMHPDTAAACRKPPLARKARRPPIDAADAAAAAAAAAPAAVRTVARTALTNAPSGAATGTSSYRSSPNAGGFSCYFVTAGPAVVVLVLLVLRGVQDCFFGKGGCGVVRRL